MIVQPDFLDHWKTNALAARIGRLEAITALLALWSHCQQRRCWEFTLTPLMLAGICRYPSDNPRVLMDTLLELNLLEKGSENTYIVHDWAETNAALVHNWQAGKTGGRPRKQPQDKPTENPRVNPGETQGEPEGEPIREDKIREEYPPVVPQGGTVGAGASSQSPDSTTSSQTEGRKKKKGARLAEPVFPADLAEDYQTPLRAWFAFKREIGKGYTASGWAALVAEQRAFPATVVAESVRKSMAANWAGLFTEKVAVVAGVPKKNEAGGGQHPGSIPIAPAVGLVSDEPPPGYERAMAALYGSDWQEVGLGWHRLDASSRRAVRQWLAAEHATSTTPL